MGARGGSQGRAEVTRQGVGRASPHGLTEFALVLEGEGGAAAARRGVLVAPRWAKGEAVEK